MRSRFAIHRPVILRAALAVAVSLGLAAPALGHDPVELRPDRAIYRPGKLPDRIVLTWNDDPATTQAVTWRTDSSITGARAQIARSGPGPDFVRTAVEVPAESTPLRLETGEALFHTAVFRALEPDTKYAYRVGDGTWWSEWLQFRTAAAGEAPLTFVYFGDAQNDLRAHWSRVVREAFSDAPRARFLLHAGDLVDNGENDSQWGEWFGAGGWVNGMIPSLATPGNHEYVKDAGIPGGRRLTRYWRPQFALPGNGPAGFEETVYSLDIQGVRIVSLDSNRDPGHQVAWLEQTLSRDPRRWTVVTFHHPVFSTKLGRDNPEIRRRWKPIFDRHRVDLVLQGHDHSYARTGLRVPENLVAGINVRSREGGTVYVVSVSGPKMYDILRQPHMRRAAEDTQLYQIITIDGETLEYEARTATGEPYDGFVLRKRPGATNELIERVPEVPERLRGKPAGDPPAGHPPVETAPKPGRDEPI